MSGNFNETTFTQANLMATWFQLEHKGIDKVSLIEYDETRDEVRESFIGQILLKRLKVFEVKVKIPIHLYLILIVGINNPGMILGSFYKILSSIPNLKEDYTIRVEDFIRVFGDTFPDSENKESEELMHKYWDEQKTGEGLNKVDSPSEWLKLFSK